MYLALFKDLIAVGGQYDNIRYSYGNDDSRYTSITFDRASQITLKTEVRKTKEMRYEESRRGFLEPQQLAPPIANVPLICITPPDSMELEPLNYTICQNLNYDGNDSRSSSDDLHEAFDQPNSSGCGIDKKDDSESTLGTDTMEDIEELSCSPFQHDVESLTKDYEDWLKLAQGAAREVCGDNLSSSNSVSPSMATSQHCQELILWRPEPTTASRKACARKFSMGRRFSLNQPMVYPFRNKRNSV